MRPSPNGPRSVTTHVTEAPVAIRVTVTTVPFGMRAVGALAGVVGVPTGAALSRALAGRGRRWPVARSPARRRWRCDRRPSRASASWWSARLVAVGRVASARRAAPSVAGVTGGSPLRRDGADGGVVGAARSHRSTTVAAAGLRFEGCCRSRGSAAPPPSARRRTTGDVGGRRTAAAPHLLGPPELRPSSGGHWDGEAVDQAITGTLRAS